MEPEMETTNGHVAPVPEAPKKLSDVEIMKMENFFLKIQNLKLQSDKLQEDYKRCGQMISDHQKQLSDYRDEVSARLGVDLAKCRIDADGSVHLQG